MVTGREAVKAGTVSVSRAPGLLDRRFIVKNIYEERWYVNQ